METRHPGSLADVVLPVPAGWRLLFVPNRARELAGALGGSIMVPPVLAAPILLAALVPAVTSGRSLFWGGFWVLLALTAVAVIALAVTMLHNTLALTVRWIEFRPSGTPAEVVIARLLRSSTVAMADLRRVVVIERLRLGQRQSIKVVLHTGSGTVECEPATSSPLSRIHAPSLTDWLTEQFGQVQVPVERRTEVERNFLCPESWWTRSHTAERWRVLAGEVDGIAVQRGVESYRYTPRAGAMSSPGTPVTVYDPGRAHDVADELRAERAADSTAARRPAEDDTRGSR
jgi:hypothetical protein